MSVLALYSDAVRGRVTAVWSNGDLVGEMGQQFLACLIEERGIVKEQMKPPGSAVFPPSWRSNLERDSGKKCGTRQSGCE